MSGGGVGKALSRARDGIRAHYAAYVGRVCARPRTAALLLLAVCLPALALTISYFSNVRAGLEQLLPKKDPVVRALDAIHARIGGQAHLTVIADSPDPAVNRRFIDEMTARMRALHLPEARSIQGRVTAERKWARARAPLLLGRVHFDRIIKDLDGAIHAAKLAADPLYIDLDASGEDAHTRWHRLEQEIKRETQGKDRFPNGYMETPDGHIVVMLIWLQGSGVAYGPSAHLLAAAKRVAAELKTHYPSSLRVAWNGEVPNLVEEHAAILADLSMSSILVFVLVALLIIVYFRSARSVLAVGGSLIPGLLITFAIGRLAAGNLNSNTAFLGAIIAGNGINYPLILLAYYRAQGSSLSLEEAIGAAARRALPGTLGAAATASAAYGGLAVSHFKGFSQFGFLGGVGMVTTWTLTFITMPIAIALLRPPRRIVRHTHVQEWLARYFTRRWLPRVVAAGLVVAALAGGVAGAVHAAHGGLYEMDLNTLRNRESLAHGSASWDKKMNQLFGVWLNPVVALVRDPGEREAAAVALRKVLVGGPHPLAGRVQTVARYVPPPAEQKARLAKLRHVSHQLADVAREDIPKKVRPWIDRWLAPDRLHPITLKEVPAPLVQAFRELSGRADRTVLIFPSLKIDYNDGRNILRFAHRLHTATLPHGTVVGGGFLFMAEIIRLVHDEAPTVVLMVALLVALVLLPMWPRRPGRVLVAILTVGAVAVIAQSIMVALGVRVNMLNFAAVPITIGVGADYVVNLYGAMDALDADARRACTSMGGAILLCSMTTIVGYVSLLAAESGALRSFGWAAVLGEIMAVTMVLLVLPVIIAPHPSPPDAPVPGVDRQDDRQDER